MLGIEPDPRKAAAQRKTARKLAFPSCVSRTEILVRLAGIEPTTPWFVAKYSIHLSYSREALHYSTVRRRVDLFRGGRQPPPARLRARICSDCAASPTARASDSAPISSATTELAVASASSCSNARSRT